MRLIPRISDWPKAAQTKTQPVCMCAKYLFGIHGVKAGAGSTGDKPRLSLPKEPMLINETAVWRRRLPSSVLNFIASEESEKTKGTNTQNTHRKLYWCIIRSTHAPFKAFYKALVPFQGNLLGPLCTTTVSWQPPSTSHLRNCSYLLFSPSTAKANKVQRPHCTHSFP